MLLTLSMSPQLSDEAVDCAMADAEPRLSPRPALGLLELDITDPDLLEPVSTSSTFAPVSEMLPMEGHASLS